MNGEDMSTLMEMKTEYIILIPVGYGIDQLSTERQILEHELAERIDPAELCARLNNTDDDTAEIDVGKTWVFAFNQFDELLS